MVFQPALISTIDRDRQNLLDDDEKNFNQWHEQLMNQWEKREERSSMRNKRAAQPWYRRWDCKALYDEASE
jgi:hypothetical protein